MKQLRIAGLTLIGTSVGFVAVFGYLASHFGYPEVLEGSAGQVLPVFVAGGTTLRLVWVTYALLPAGLALAAWLARPLLAQAGGRVALLGSGAALLSALAMTLGLARWPTLNYALGERFLLADAAERSRLAASFDAGNLWLGNVTGEFVGEVALSVWFGALGLSFLRGASRRWLGYFALFTAVCMLIGALRNLTRVVAPIAAVDNTLLPVFLITVGVVLAIGYTPRAVTAPLAVR